MLLNNIIEPFFNITKNSSQLLLEICSDPFLRIHTDQP